MWYIHETTNQSTLNGCKMYKNVKTDKKKLHFSEWVPEVFCIIRSPHICPCPSGGLVRQEKKYRVLFFGDFSMQYSRSAISAHTGFNNSNDGSDRSEKTFSPPSVLQTPHLEAALRHFLLQTKSIRALISAIRPAINTQTDVRDGRPRGNSDIRHPLYKMYDY